VLNEISAALGSPFGLAFNTTLLGSKTLRDITSMAEMFAFSQISYPNATQNISFIPTISSLGLFNSQFNWSLPLAKNLVCNNLTPFDAYYVPTKNEEHVSFTAESWAWLKEELLHGRGGSDCFDVCATTFNGNANTCKGTTETYTLDVPIPNVAGYSTTYKVSAGLSISVSNNNAVKVLTNAGGSQWIEATIKSPCAPDKIIISYINVVDPAITYAGSFSTFSFGNACMPDIIWSTTNTSLTGYTVEWSVDNTNFYRFGSGFTGWIASSGHNSLPAFYIQSGNSMRLKCLKNTPKVYARISTPCGLAGLYNYTFSTSPCTALCKRAFDVADAPDNFTVDVYPNPTTDKWQVMLSDFVNIKDAQFKLFDLNGKVVWSLQKNNFEYSNVEIPAAHLPKGVYTLQIVTDRQSGTYRLSKD
jgi:Secretion system C-terminal sorting domain